MNTTAAAAATPAETEKETVGKERIYEKISELVKDKTDKRIGKTGGRDVFDLVVAEIFALATKEGTVRLNGGFGSFHVRNYQAGSRRLPSGKETSFGERSKLRYEEGVVVRELVKNKGDLDKAVKVRGSRAQSDTKKPADKAPQKVKEGAKLD